MIRLPALSMLLRLPVALGVHRASEEEDVDALADAVHRLAVLLAAGLEPLSALRALEATHPALAAAAGCGSVVEVPAALVARAGEAATGTSRAVAYLAGCWTVAVEAGAPLAPALERAAESLHAIADADRQRELALAGPLATARIVALLPFAGIGMGLLIGADPLGVVVGTVPGAVAAAGGIAALVVGLRWNERMIAAARTADPLAGAGHELLALALAGGAPPDAALARARSAADRLGIAEAVRDAGKALAFAVRHGVPVAALLRAEAARVRRRALADALRRAALLGTRLLAPLALCFLPGFVLLGVVPLLIGILRATLATF